MFKGFMTKCKTFLIVMRRIVNNSCSSNPFFRQIFSTSAVATVTTTGAQNSPIHFVSKGLVDMITTKASAKPWLSHSDRRDTIPTLDDTSKMRALNPFHLSHISHLTDSSFPSINLYGIMDSLSILPWRQESPTSAIALHGHMHVYSNPQDDGIRELPDNVGVIWKHRN